MRFISNVFNNYVQLCMCKNNFIDVGQTNEQTSECVVGMFLFWFNIVNIWLGKQASKYVVRVFHIEFYVINIWFCSNNRIVSMYTFLCPSVVAKQTEWVDQPILYLQVLF